MVAMAWWNWALVLWATGATAGAGWLAVVLARHAGWHEEQGQESEALAGLLDEGAGQASTPEAGPVGHRIPAVLLTRLRHTAPHRSR
ncbi:hypothetical protein ACI78V_06600 [Geodermatophilus sp. SYSU D00742]